MAKRQVIFSMLLTVLSGFCLAVLWEFWLEPALEPGEFKSESNSERWEFVWTSVAFAAIALIVASLISLRNIAGAPGPKSPCAAPRIWPKPRTGPSPSSSPP